YRSHAIIDRDRVRPIPLLPIVRWIGHEDAETIPKRLAAGFVEHLYRIVSAHAREADLAAPRAHALETLAKARLDDVDLLSGPKDSEDEAALRPLSRARVLSYYPSTLIGDGP